MLGIFKAGDHLFKKGYGLANLEHTIPIHSGTVFNVASLSKQFTAACIALLILDKQLDLEDSVRQYLPFLPDYMNDIQLKHLIYMTSGINDYYYNERPNGNDWSSLHFFDIDTAIVASMSDGALMYPPGTQWSYSNINYMLMAKIVEKISGKSFADFARDRIFTPLGMDHTRFNDDIFEVIPNRASAYNFRDEENTGWLKEGGYLKAEKEGLLQINRNSPHYGGSGLFTSMDDLKKWLDNFETKSFGGTAFYDLMHSTMQFKHDKANDAFGLVWGDFNGHDMVWYEGGDWGVSSYMMRFPKNQLSIVCLSNLGTGKTREKVQQLMDILLADGVLQLE